MSTGMLTELPDHFENTEAMEAVINKAYESVQADHAAEVAAAAEPPAAGTNQGASDANSAGDVSAVSAEVPVSEGQVAKPEVPATSPAPQVQDWLDNELRGLATAVGVPEKVLGEVGSRQELERMLSVIEQRAVEAGKKQFPGESPKVEEKKPLVPAQSSTDAAAQQQARDVSKYLMADAFDDGVTNPHNQFVKDTDARIAALEAMVQAKIQPVVERLANAEQNRGVQSTMQQFDSALDSIGHPELFGVAGERTAEQLANAARVWDFHRAHVLGLMQQGRQGRTDKTFVSRAVQAEFGEQLTKQAQKQVTDKLKKQQSKIMGGPSGKALGDVSNGKVRPTENPAVMAELKAEYERLERGG